jgi:hypothetical protein
MGTGCCRNPNSTEHTRDFLDPFCFFQGDNGGSCSSLTDLFGYLKMVIAESGDLGKVGDTNHLMVF